MIQHRLAKLHLFWNNFFIENEKMINKTGIILIVLGIVVWLFGPFFDQFKDVTTVKVLVAALVITGIILIVKTSLNNKSQTKNKQQKK